MAKGFERREYQGRQGMQYGDHPDAINLQKLGEVVSDLYMCTDDRDRTRMWATAARLLSKSKADKERVAKVMLEKRVGALSKLVTDLQQELNAPKVGRAALANQTPGQAGSPAGPANDQKSANPSEAVGSTPESSIQPNRTDAPAAPTSQGPTADELKQALKAFKKRMKLTRLDEESRLGNRAMTGGHKSAVVAIMPPREYPRSVWEELVKQGKLKPAGAGFYRLVEGA